MVFCSKRVYALEGALQRAFFSRALPHGLVLLISTGLHVALLWSWSAAALVPLPAPHWQTFSVRLVQPQALPIVSELSTPSVSVGHATVPVKIRPAAVPSNVPKIAADPVIEKSIAAASPHIASDPIPPVAGIALPQPGAVRGRRSLWSFSPESVTPDGQALYQAQMQRQAQRALEASRLAARKEFEAHIISALQAMQLRAPCRLIVPPDGDIRQHCDDEQDANSVRSAVDQSGNVPAVQSQAMWFIIDLVPQPGNVQVRSAYANSEM